MEDSLGVNNTRLTLPSFPLLVEHSVIEGAHGFPYCYVLLEAAWCILIVRIRRQMRHELQTAQIQGHLDNREAL